MDYVFSLPPSLSLSVSFSYFLSVGVCKYLQMGACMAASNDSGLLKEMNMRIFTQVRSPEAESPRSCLFDLVLLFPYLYNWRTSPFYSPKGRGYMTPGPGPRIYPI